MNCALGYLNVVTLSKKFEKAKLREHSYCTFYDKKGENCFDWDNEWKGNIENVPEEIMKGFFWLDDSIGFSFTNYACGGGTNNPIIVFITSLHSI